MDPRLRGSTERDRLERITDNDLKKAEEFTKLMKIMYTSTLCVSSDNTPTCGQVLPILQKLEEHFKFQEDDTVFVSGIKQKVWADLSKRYQNEDIRHFLEEATVMDPRFKNKFVADTIWERVRVAAVASISKVPEGGRGIDHDNQDNTTEVNVNAKCKFIMIYCWS
ncbi:uncharacterized protein LOC132859418 [Tachysurus vachellii]|uniref:uncharacterized protein LOC132859418 n=1 Tax=Tachysurus vachellii TaxID=175792 RepID=UPI00296AFAB6|nr:uncharacterized protein LOC132859418 [Tachysurus vachellii]